jgi:hypothetical protein
LVLVNRNESGKKLMPLSLDDSARISARLRTLSRAYEASDYLTVIQEGEAFESSLDVEDWDDINFVSLKLILYCAYRHTADGGDSQASGKASSRRQEMLNHNANPECRPLSFAREPVSQD